MDVKGAPKSPTSRRNATIGESGAATRPLPWSNRQIVALIGVLLLVAGVRLYLNSSRDWVGYDEANYLMIARNADAGEGYTRSTLAEYQPKFHLASAHTEVVTTTLLLR